MEFIIEGKPQGKARPRVVRNRYTGKTHGVTPAQTKSYEDLIRLTYRQAKGIYFAESPLQVSIEAYYPMPKGFSKAKRNEAVNGKIRPCTKPDCDNIIKIILDALNGLAYYDDKQVICVSCNKYYAESGYVKVKIDEL